jgi:hypothetical protein
VEADKLATMSLQLKKKCVGNNAEMANVSLKIKIYWYHLNKRKTYAEPTPPWTIGNI